MIEYPKHLKSPNKKKKKDSDDTSSLGSREIEDEALRLAKIVLGNSSMDINSVKRPSKIFLMAIQKVAALKHQLEILQTQCDQLREGGGEHAHHNGNNKTKTKKTTSGANTTVAASTAASSSKSKVVPAAAAPTKKKASPQQQPTASPNATNTNTTTTIDDIMIRLSCWNNAFTNLNDTHLNMMKKCQMDLQQIHFMLQNQTTADKTTTRMIYNQCNELQEKVQKQMNYVDIIRTQEQRIQQLELQLQQEKQNRSVSPTSTTPTTTTTTNSISPTTSNHHILLDDDLLIFDNDDDKSESDHYDHTSIMMMNLPSSSNYKK